jgi:hypothetical protein
MQVRKKYVKISINKFVKNYVQKLNISTLTNIETLLYWGGDIKMWMR